MDSNHESALKQTGHVLRLLTHPDRQNLDWWDEFDLAFWDALFAFDNTNPYVRGPDHLDYFALQFPRMGDVMDAPSNLLCHARDYVAGATVSHPDGEPLHVISPGDIVSLALFRQTRVQWGGAWGQPPETESYARGGDVQIGRPNEHMLPPLAARSLEFMMRLFLRAHPVLAKTLTPGICLVRPSSRTKPEDASELALNVTLADLGGDGTRMRAFIEGACHFLPWHLANRLISAPESLAKEHFTPLKTIVEEGGLALAPDR